MDTWEVAGLSPGLVMRSNGAKVGMEGPGSLSQLGIREVF